MDESAKFAVIEVTLRLSLLRDKNSNKWATGNGYINIVYAGTREGSPLRRLLVDLYVSTGNQSWMASDYDSIFLLDLAKAFMQKLEKATYVTEIRGRSLTVDD